MKQKGQVDEIIERLKDFSPRRSQSPKDKANVYSTINSLQAKNTEKLIEALKREKKEMRINEKKLKAKIKEMTLERI
jgi:ABC-type transporter MlaC component